MIFAVGSIGKFTIKGFYRSHTSATRGISNKLIIVLPSCHIMLLHFYIPLLAFLNRLTEATRRLRLASFRSFLFPCIGLAIFVPFKSKQQPAGNAGPLYQILQPVVALVKISLQYLHPLKDGNTPYPLHCFVVFVVE